MPFDKAAALALFLWLEVCLNRCCIPELPVKAKGTCPLILCPFWVRHGAERGAGGPMCQQFQTNAGKAAS